MNYYITTPADYWIAPNAVNISLNALGEYNRIQASVSSGAVVMCFVEDIKAESAGGEPGNGDGLWYDTNHEPRRWPLTVSPTYFNNDTRKYVYAAIPRSTTVGTQAVIVFPSDQLDIYGRVQRESVQDGSPVLSYEQIGSTDYFYVYLGGIISAPENGARHWEQEITDWGRLDTTQGRDEKQTSAEWYLWSTVSQTVTFMKKIFMGPDSWFQNLILGQSQTKGELIGVATGDNADVIPQDSTQHVVTPSYIDEFGNTRYLRKDQDDATPFSLGIGGTLTVGESATVGGDTSIGGTATIGQSLNVTDDITAGKDLSVGGNANIDGSSRVGGDQTVGTDLIVNGSTYANNGVRTDTVRSTNYTGDSIGDTGYLLTANHNGHSKLTIDEIYVRMKAVFESLEVKKWSVTAGDEIRSCAANVISRVDYYADASQSPLGYSYVRVPWLLKSIPIILSKFSEGLGRKMYSALAKVRKSLTEEQLKDVRFCRCYFLAKDGDTEIQNWWQVDDLARCQTMNIASTVRDTYVNGHTRKEESEPGDGKGNVFWWRKVIRVSSEPVELEQGKSYHYFDVAFDYEAEKNDTASVYALYGSDIPAAGDHVSQFGNTVVPGRMNLMMIQVNGGSDLTYDATADAPCIKAYKGIYCFNLNKCWFGGSPLKMKLSPSTGYEFYGPEFKVVKEYGSVPVPTQRGAWTDIVAQKDDYSPYAQVRKCYYYDEVSHKGCTWLCSISDGAHWVYPDNDSVPMYDAHGNYLHNGHRITDGQYEALTDAKKALCGRQPDYTIDEPSTTSPNWRKIVDRGTSVASVTVKYAKSNQGTVPPNSGWVDEQHIPDLGMKDGDYLWTWTHTEYSDTLEPTNSYQASRWGIDGDGIASVKSYYYGTTSATAINADNDNYSMPVNGDDSRSQWKNSFANLVGSVTGGLGAMQGWYVWQKTIIHYDLPEGKSEQKPDVKSYQCNRIGQDGQIGQKEYYMLAASDDFNTVFGSATPDYAHIGIRWYNQASPATARYRLSSTTPNIDPSMWSETRPAYNKTTHGNKIYLWNFEQRTDGMGTEYATKPVCIGNHARGIVGVQELYALSVSGQPQSNHHIPDDIYEANGNSETDYSHSDPSVPETWNDEMTDRAPTEALPYQWNWTRTIYSTKDASGKDYEDRYHVSSVRGTKGEDGAGTEYIYCRTQTETAPKGYNGTEGTANGTEIKGTTIVNGQQVPRCRTVDDYVPKDYSEEIDGKTVTYQWSDNPVGIAHDWPYEWVCERKSSNYAGTGGFSGGHLWSTFSAPKPRSKWGYNGVDGDGTEYVFVRTSSPTAPTITDSSDTYGSKTYLDDDYLPLSSAGRCTDDPQGTTRDLPYEWVAKRTKAAASKETGNYGHRDWEKYSGTMARWSTYSTLRLDITNEIDSVHTDSAGKITAARTVETVVHLYDGATEVAMNAVTVTGGPVTSGTGKIAEHSQTASGNGRKLSWTFIAGKTMSAAYEITVSYTYNNNQYTAVFTITASLDQPIFQLKPTLSSVSFSRLSTNALTPSSRDLELSVIKLDAASTQEFVFGSFPAEVLVRYSTSAMPANKDAGKNWGESDSTTGISWSSGKMTLSSSVAIGNVFIAMFNTAGTLLDRETIPVVKDGKNGEGINSADVVFAINQSGTTEPGDDADWETLVSDLESSSHPENDYLWQATKVTYTIGGNTAYTGKVCLGKMSEFASVTEQYALGTQTAATGTWQNNTPPAPTKGSYLWTRTKLVYTSGNNKTSYVPSADGMCIGYWGIDGENSIRLALDNEHEDFLYSDKQTLPIAPSATDGAKSVIHLYDGQNEVTLTTSMLSIDSSSSGVPTSGDYKPTIISEDSKIKLKVPHITANTAKVVVKATYNRKPYYAEFTANKTSQDKYDIVVAPSSVAYNSATFPDSQLIAISYNRTTLQGGQETGLTPSTSEANGNVCVYYSFVNNDGTKSSPLLVGSLPFTLSKSNAGSYAGVYFELRKITGGSSGNWQYRMCDYETVEIAKAENGTSPWFVDSSNEMDSVACDNDLKAIVATNIYSQLIAFHGIDDIIRSCQVKYTSKPSAVSLYLQSSETGTSTSYPVNSTYRDISTRPYLLIQVAKSAQLAARQTVELMIKHVTYGELPLTITINGLKGGATYRLIPSANVIAKSVSNTYTPATLTCEAKKLDVATGAETSLASSYIKYTKDGGSTENAYTSLTPGTSFTSNVTFLLYVNSVLVDKETVSIVKDGKDGEPGQNSVRLALDNEHEDFLYNDAGTLVSPSGGATSVIHLYDGNTDKIQQIDNAQLTISGREGTTAELAYLSNRKLVVEGITADSAKVTVRAEYPYGSGKYYYADFTANKARQDKYDLLLNPNSIAYNPASYATQTIEIAAQRFDLSGGKTDIGWGSYTDKSKISNSAAGDGRGYLRMYATYIDQVSAGVYQEVEKQITGDFAVTADIASHNTGIYFELRWYDNNTAAGTTAHRICDYETVEIAKSENGTNGSGFKKVNTYLRDYSLATWKSYMRDGETWGLATSAGGSQYYDNSHISVGDTCYIIGKVTDKLDKSGNKVDIAAYGVCTGFQTSGNTRTSIIMNMTHYITSGEDGDDAVVYSLVTTPDTVNFRSNAVGDFSPTSVSVSCTIKKTVGSTESTITSGTDGKYLYYRLNNSNTWVSYTGSISVTAASALAESNTVTAVLFALSASYTPSGVDSSNPLIKTVPVILDGRRGAPGTPGTPGATGKMFYSMGEWTAQSYSRSDDYIPLVHYNDGSYSEATGEGAYYYLSADSASSSDIPGSSNKWTKATEYGVVITQGLFAEFAKLGHGIVSGDYLFSMNGRIGGTSYVSGSKIDGYPAYTYFVGDGGREFTFARNGLSGYSSSNKCTLQTIQIATGVKAVISIKLTSNSGGVAYFNLYDKNSTSQGSVFFISSGTKSITFTPTQTGAYTLKCYNSNSTATYSFSVTVTLTPNTGKGFEPNWWVDLLTGKMSAAQGNFVVNENGSVTVSGTVNATDGVFSGTLEAARYGYKIYLSEEANHEYSQAESDYIVASASDGAEVHLYSSDFYARRLVTIVNPVERDDATDLCIVSDTRIRYVDALSGGTTSYPIGFYNSVKLWADVSKGVWRILEINRF